MATFRKKRSRKYKRRNTRRNRRSKKSLVGGAEEYKYPEKPKFSLPFGPNDLIQAIRQIISNEGSNEQYTIATNFIRNMRSNIVLYTTRFKATLNNNIDDKREQETIISSFEPRLINVKAELDQLYKETSFRDEASIIKEARKIGIDYYTAMLETLMNIFDIH
jgi:hypothetical protein